MLMTGRLVAVAVSRLVRFFIIVWWGDLIWALHSNLRRHSWQSTHA